MPDVLPLSRRPFDVAVVAFLISHIPITILIDSQPLFPSSLYPGFARNAFTWYIAQFQDPLMTLMPAWFRVLCWSEIYVQLPFFFIAAYAHAFGKTWIQKPTIVYGLFVASTMVCVLSELVLSPHSKHPRFLLSAFYLPYFVFPFAMAVRMLMTDCPFESTNGRYKKQA